MKKNKFGWLKTSAAFFSLQTRLFYLHRKKGRNLSNPPVDAPWKGSIKNPDEITCKFILTIAIGFLDFWTIKQSLYKPTNPPRKTSERAISCRFWPKVSKLFSNLSIRRVFIYVFVPHDPWPMTIISALTWAPRPKVPKVEAKMVASATILALENISWKINKNLQFWTFLNKKSSHNELMKTIFFLGRTVGGGIMATFHRFLVKRSIELWQRLHRDGWSNGDVSKQQLLQWTTAFLRAIELWRSIFSGWLCFQCGDLDF